MKLELITDTTFTSLGFAHAKVTQNGKTIGFIRTVVHLYNPSAIVLTIEYSNCIDEETETRPAIEQDRNLEPDL